MRISPLRGRALACGLLALFSTSSLCCRPARALEEIQLRLPLLETNFIIKVSELGSRQKLRQGNSDLAELDRASNGALGRQLEQLFDTPLPLRVKKLVANSAGTPLFEQALLVASILGKIDGLPNRVDGEQLKGAADLDAAVAMAKEAGFDVSKADWLKYQANQILELSDEELERVSGGRNLNSFFCTYTCGGFMCF